MDLRTLRYFAVVAEERNVGRAAARLRMTQPPLTRALHALEDELGVLLLTRSARGIEPTPAGEVLRRRASALVAEADRLGDEVRRAAGDAIVRVGVLADSTEHLDPAVTAAFRRSHPHVELRVREHDLADPSAGLRSGDTDVAFTRLPFDTTSLRTRVLGRERIGVLVRRDDPIAGLSSVELQELADRHWVRLPPDADPAWLASWTGGPTTDEEPVARTVQECVQHVLWNGRLALAPLGQRIPEALAVVPTDDRPPSELVVVWDPSAAAPATRAFLAAVRVPGGRGAACG